MENFGVFYVLLHLTMAILWPLFEQNHLKDFHEIHNRKAGQEHTKSKQDLS